MCRCCRISRRRAATEAAVVEDQIYCWGGVSYEKPYAYKDGYRLSPAQGRMGMGSPADLPVANRQLYPGVPASSARKSTCWAADYDHEKFYTNTDHTGQVERCASGFQLIDTKNLDGGMKELPSCPGTPRFVHAVAAVGGKIYVIGGAAGADNPSNSYCTVVDNWRYDPQTEQWERLADPPVASGNFPAGPIVYQNRYILLIGGVDIPKSPIPTARCAKFMGKSRTTTPTTHTSATFSFTMPRSVDLAGRRRCR